MDSYIDNTSQDVEYIVIGDEKTKFDYDRFTTYDFEYYDVTRQKAWIHDNFIGVIDYDDVCSAIPWNSVRRRNLGYLIALEHGAEVIVTVDDDNFQEVGWLEKHLSALEKARYIVSSMNRVVNPCEFLEFYTKSNIYMRGYPIFQMFSDETTIVAKESGGSVLNMGLWKHAPDVDAATNLVYTGLQSSGFNRLVEDCSYAVASYNYIPINTQNTAFMRKVTPAYYTLLMDTMINGLLIDRYDDIWAGWILQKIAHHLGDHVSFGQPLSNHIRNKHDYLRDFSCEYVGMILNSRFFNFIDSLVLN